ncbi:FAD-dependent thymidylate synthase [Candidatus Fermentibacteria bacterium]|nr:FAD-dependent thymidylate synthase [Candidatus Fermentibacteria bacterium]
MLVTLAGTNTPLRASPGDATPEVICAAYARISRSPLPVHELRARARDDLPKTRAFTERIVYHLGHESVAEHAVFNLDILGISRLVTEIVEHSRLASYTERSQRYICLGEDFLIPHEARELGFSKSFGDLVRQQHAVYRAAAKRLSASGDSRAAKEDARYALGLATTTQLGLTANARALASMLARLETGPLHEARTLGNRIRRLVARVAPALIPAKSPSEAPVETMGINGLSPWVVSADAPALVWHTPEPEQAVRDALQFCGGKFWQPRPVADGASALTVLPRAFEAVQLAFVVVVSASAFAQLKRHRMASILAQPYDPALGLTIPPTVEAAGMAREFEELASRSTEMRVAMAKDHPAAGAYGLLNAHRRRVLLVINARAFHQMARLRLDHHAQWDIRRQVGLMTDELRARLPSLARLLSVPEGETAD